MPSLEKLAADFSRAFYERQWPGDDEPAVSGLSLADAYRVQGLVASNRTAEGERVVGYKVGCTSAAIRAQFGLTEPIFGRLFAPHTRPSNGTVDWSGFANCAIEPEMVIEIGDDLSGGDLSDERLVDAIDRVRPGVELHHFKFWRTPPTTQELICSGGIHAGLLIGEGQANPRDLTFHDEMFSVFRNGRRVASARAEEIMGGPLHSLRWLVRALDDQGLVLSKGSLVIPGSPVELVAVDADTGLAVDIERVGRMTVEFRRTRNAVSAED